LPLRRNGNVVAQAVLDAADHAALSAFTWYLTPKGYVTRREGRRTIFLHREILGFEYRDGKIADHINGDKLDNRRANLRECPRGQRDNLQNRRRFKNNRSGHRGVCKCGPKWRAYGYVDGKQHHLGLFEDPQEAARVASEFRARHMPFSADARAAA
jgi:hypothetical protein